MNNECEDPGLLGLTCPKIMSHRSTEIRIRREAIKSQTDEGHLTIPYQTVLSNGARYRDLRQSIQIMMEQVFSNNSLVGGLVPVKSMRVGVPHYLFVVAVDLFPRTSDKGATTGTLSVASMKRISKHPMFVRAIFGVDVV